MADITRRSRHFTWRWIASLWAALVVLFFLWQSVAYRGLVAFMGEWQFNTFGIYRPALTYFVFVAILAPLPLLFRRRRKRALMAPEQLGAVPVVPGLSSALRSATRFLRLLLVLAGASFAVALVALVGWLLLPSDAGPVQRITASDTLPATPAEGATELRGKILYNRTSAFDQNLWVVRRNTRFAPVIEEGADETAIRYFVELPPTDRPDLAAVSVRRGILKRNALPGELLRLYSYAGFRVFPEHYVLFSTAAPMGWPYLVTALEFAGAGLLILLGGAVQWFRRRRLVARHAEPIEVG